jgi:hypothetical protein
MNKHPHLTALAAAATVAAVAVLVLAVGAQAHRSGARTLRLTITATKISTVDVPPLITGPTSPESAGDELLAVSNVSGAAAGRRYLICTVTKTAPSIATALYSCQVTYVLTHGTVTAAGVIHVTGRATAAVTGGTGAYAGTHGSVVSKPGSDTLTLR